MNRVIQFNIIKNVSNQLIKELEKLQIECDKLNLDIEKIEEFYKGKDANLIIAKYNQRVNIIKKYIEIVKEYINYFDWISSNYHDTYHNAIKHYQNSVVEEPVEQLFNQMLGEDVINLEENLNVKEGEESVKL